MNTDKQLEVYWNILFRYTSAILQSIVQKNNYSTAKPLKQNNMKKLNLFFAFITLLLLSSCNRNVTNPSTDGNTIEKDTSLLFALNIGSSSISDTSVYKDVITINNTTLSFQNNALGFAEDYDEFDPLHEPFIRIQLPEKKLSNKLTAFIELKNSLQNSKSDYGDTSNYYIWATLG
jgi:hypothetical protein